MVKRTFFGVDPCSSLLTDLIGVLSKTELLPSLTVMIPTSISGWTGFRPSPLYSIRFLWYLTRYSMEQSSGWFATAEHFIAWSFHWYITNKNEKFFLNAYRLDSTSPYKPDYIRD